MAFDPKKYVLKDLQEDENKATAFDPKEYVKKDLMDLDAGQDQVDPKALAIQQEASKRLNERASKPSEPSPKSFKRFTTLAQSEDKNALGDAVYAAANFGGVLPKGVALGETITGTRPVKDGSFLDNLKANIDIEKEVAKQRKERSPTASAAGELGGDIAAYATGTKVLKSLPIIGEVAGGSKAKKLLKMLTRGGATNATIGQLRGKDASAIPLDAAIGAGGELVGSAGGKILDEVGNLLKKDIVPEKLLYASDSIPIYGKIQKGLREDAQTKARDSFNSRAEEIKARLDQLKELKSDTVAEAQNAYRYNKEAARNRLRDLSQAEPAELGEKFSGRIKSSKEKLSREYGDISDKLFSQYGDQPASVEPLRKEITETLRKDGFLDPNGNVDLTRIDLIQSPDRKRMVQTLANMTESLKANPTIKEINSLKQDLQSLANFNAPVRTPEQALFGRLSDTAKRSLDDALEAASGNQAEAFRGVRQKYAQQKPNLDSLSKTATRLPERLVINARVQFPKSKVQEILKTNPEFKDDIGNFIFEHITQTPASQNTIRKTMDYYGRDFLKDLLGKEKFNKLLVSEADLTSAFSQFDWKKFDNKKTRDAIAEILGKEVPEKDLSKAFKAAQSELSGSIGTFEYKDPKIQKIKNILLSLQKGTNKASSISKKAPKILVPAFSTFNE